ncbi:MAG: transglycosylase SLT domain-containing protein [Candidatus Cloacimonadota bacterium]|nr:transglycosylase SLT domain-containing protein [Candidatus Cloacimonadota bacterium]
MIVENLHNPASALVETTDFQSKQKIMSTCKKFEAIFLNQMLQMMQQNGKTEGVFGNSHSLDMFNSMLYSRIAELLANSSQTGISSEIYESITGEMPDAKLLSKSDSPSQIIFNKIKENFQTVTDKIGLNPKDIHVTEAIMTNFEKAINKILKPYLDIINASAKKNDVNPNLVKAVILRESAGNPNAISHVGAKGLMQLMDGTAKDMNVKNVFNPKDNINGGTKYLAKMLKIFKSDIDSSLAAYNAGPRNVQKYNGIPPFRETINYVNSVKTIFNKLEGNDTK